MPKLMRATADQSAIEQFDPSQSAVLGSTDRVQHVLGAPGTGKTSVAVELLARGVADGLRPDECVLLSPTRVAAGALRSLVTARLAGTSTEPLARTPGALAFGILRAKAVLDGLPTPRLLTGPEQDIVIKELLAGHAAGLGKAPQWPLDLALALPTRGFRNEIRDLLMRAVEWGLSADDLARLGHEHGRDEWVAAARFLDEYDDVTALSRPGAYDPAWILGAAAAVLRDDEQLAEKYRNQFKLIVIDDAQELTKAAVGFLDRLVGPSSRLVVIGDPDVTVQSFRGADPSFMFDVVTQAGGASPCTLTFGYRLPGEIDEVRQRVSASIGVVGSAAHRNVAHAPAPDSSATNSRVRVALLRSGAQEAAHIAGYLRHARLIQNIAWRDMAVIVRGSAGTSALRRALNAARVPVAVPPASLALRDEPSVRPFLTALDVVTDASAPSDLPDSEPESGGRAPLPVDVAHDLLTSPLGNADPVAMRRLRRALRAYELANGGSRTSDQLLGTVLVDPVLAASIGPDGAAARRVAKVLTAGWSTLDAEGVSADAEHVLWAMWEASGLAEPWQQAALDGGVAGTRADRDLDAMLALFSAAATFVDRLPDAPAREFLESIRTQDVPGDRLVAAAPDDDAVQLLTPAAAAGGSWHTVVIAGVQEGVWPDLRLRGSILGSSDLVDLLSGRGESLRERTMAVRYDETRQFLVALTRARGQVLVTAVRDEEEQPSQFIDLVDPVGSVGGVRGFTDVARPMTLSGVVAESRRMLTSSDEQLRHEAAERLALLADEGVPGADPSSWWSLVALSDDRPLRLPEEPVRVSPSKIEGFHDCGLRWLLTNHGGFGPSSSSATLGTLIHELAQEFCDADAGERRRMMLDALDERWSRVGLPDGWESTREKTKAQEIIGRLDTYFAQVEALGWRTVATEKPFKTQIDRAILAGSVDRIESNHLHGARIIDFKTGKSKPKPDEVPVHPQLAAYQLAALNGAFGSEPNAGAALVQLGKDKKPTVQQQDALTDEESSATDQPATDASAADPASHGPTPGSLSWARQMLAETADGMGAATFLAKPERQRCGTCPVRSSCPLQPEGRSL